MSQINHELLEKRLNNGFNLIKIEYLKYIKNNEKKDQSQGYQDKIK
jgi:hypothetical protein